MTQSNIVVLGIETSCDETSVAIVDSNHNIISQELFSQIQIHKQYGGVVPEVAARQHLVILAKLVQRTLSNFDPYKLDAISVTTEPGLIGGLIVGTMVAKGIASVLSKPYIHINHLEGHTLTIRLTNRIDFPYLLLLLSGGHSQILITEGVGKYVKLGETKDDAIGETFDKIAQALDLSYPGGPAIEYLAKKGNKRAFIFPKPLYKQKNCDFSFSGLKTAVIQCIEKCQNKKGRKLLENEVADICASFQESIVEILKDRLLQAFRKNYSIPNKIVLAGGVAANDYIRTQLGSFLQERKLTLLAPPPALCVDNAAMIAWAGVERLKAFGNAAFTHCPSLYKVNL